MKSTPKIKPDAADFVPRELRDLSFVPRWVIIRSVRGQNVAEHSYYVAVYASMLFDIFGDAWPMVSEAALVRAALVHDLDETFTGDIPGPSKRQMVNDELSRDFTSKQMMNRFPRYIYNDWRRSKEDHIKRILNVANLMDEVFYLATEMQLGNKSIAGVMGNSTKRLMSAISALPELHRAAKNDFANKVKVWIEEHVKGNSKIVTD